MNFLIANWLILAIVSFVCVVLAVVNQLLTMRQMFKLEGPPSMSRFGVSALLMVCGSFSGIAALLGFIAELLKTTT